MLRHSIHRIFHFRIWIIVLDFTAALSFRRLCRLNISDLIRRFNVDHTGIWHNIHLYPPPFCRWVGGTLSGSAGDAFNCRYACSCTIEVIQTIFRCAFNWNLLVNYASCDKLMFCVVNIAGRKVIKVISSGSNKLSTPNRRQKKKRIIIVSWLEKEAFIVALKA